MQQAQNYHGVLNNALCLHHISFNYFGLTFSAKDLFNFFKSSAFNLTLKFLHQLTADLNSYLMHFASALSQMHISFVSIGSWL